MFARSNGIEGLKWVIVLIDAGSLANSKSCLKSQNSAIPFAAHSAGKHVSLSKLCLFYFSDILVIGSGYVNSYYESVGSLRSGKAVRRHHNAPIGRLIRQRKVILAGIVATASASWNGAPSWGGPGGWSGGGGGWQGPPANVVVQNGQVQDTPEVQAEKAKHFNLVAQASAAAAAAGPDNSGQWNDNNGQWNGDNGQYANNGQYGNQGPWNPAPQWNGPPANTWAGNGHWSGSPAKIVVNNGQVQETPEVAAARAQHLAALQAAGAGAGAHGPPNPHWG